MTGYGALPRPWEVAGTVEYTPEMLAVLEAMPMVRVDRAEWANTPILRELGALERNE